MIKMLLAGPMLLVALNLLASSQARTLDPKDFDPDDSVSSVIPSPNQDFGDEQSDLRRTSSAGQQSPAASNEAAVPIYVSPFVRPERSLSMATSFERQESSHAPPNFAPRPQYAASAPTAATNTDLKTSASYGHHHGHHGYDHSGWLDMGAWTGGKGSFGWYADYPVGKKHGYGRK